MEKKFQIKVILVLAMALVLLGYSPVLAAARYVKADATGTNNGASWTRAMYAMADCIIRPFNDRQAAAC
jgi:hypothetical protein